MRKRPLTPGKYYRLPWNLADNAITWLEPTTKCNLYCEGCYRENDPQGHKPLAQVIKDLETVKQQRHTDGISIAGGEPLIYPDLIPLVRYVVSQGWKPIINSNGQALTPELVRELTAAGVVGFTMHVDSHQRRPGWKGATEKDLCELRYKLASMIHEHSHGRVACSFNATIYRDTLSDIPLLSRWAHEHIDIVQTMVFILFRSARKKNNFDVFANGRPVDVGNLVYQLDNQEHHQDIMSQEIADAIRLAYPEHEPCAFLNGSEDTRTMKWLLTLRVGTKDDILGYLDAKFAEWTQVFHHLFFGTYLAYARPCWMHWVQRLLPLAPFNKSLRKIFGRLLLRPKLWFKPINIQSVMVIQPCDLFPDGRQNMCDGCPDAIAYKGRLVWSCRVDELEKFGSFIQCAPRGCGTCPSSNASKPASDKEPETASSDPDPAPAAETAPETAPEPTPDVVPTQPETAATESQPAEPATEPEAAATSEPEPIPVPEPEPEPEPASEPPVAVAPEPEPEPTPAQPESAATEPQPAEPTTEPKAAATSEPEPTPVPEPEPEPEPAPESASAGAPRPASELMAKTMTPPVVKTETPLVTKTDTPPVVKTDTPPMVATAPEPKPAGNATPVPQPAPKVATKAAAKSAGAKAKPAKKSKSKTTKGKASASSSAAAGKSGKSVKKKTKAR